MSKIAIQYPQNDSPRGISLGAVECGTVVKSMKSGRVYLVVSSGAGFKRRDLVLLCAGKVVYAPQDLEVLPLSATLIVHGVDATTVAGAS